MADACLHLLENYDGPDQVNVGTGTDVTIREIAATVASAVGYRGETAWDTTKPDGTPQKLLDVSKLTQAGWTAGISLQDGVERTVAWYRENIGTLRS
jgi:GDP-L-fucose synthase